MVGSNLSGTFRRLTVITTTTLIATIAAPAIAEPAAIATILTLLVVDDDIWLLGAEIGAGITAAGVWLADTAIACAVTVGDTATGEELDEPAATTEDDSLGVGTMDEDALSLAPYDADAAGVAPAVPVRVPVAVPEIARELLTTPAALVPVAVGDEPDTGASSTI